MLDHRIFARDPQAVFQQLKRRAVGEDVVTRLSQLVERRRGAIQHLEALRQQLNQETAQVQAQSRSGDTDAVSAARAQLKRLKAEIKEAEQAQQKVESELQTLLLEVPNLPQESVPDGPDETHNRVERVVGSPPTWDWEPRAHWDLGVQLGILDFERATKMSGARFAVYRGAGARLERALTNLMLDLAREHGYVEVLPPVLVRRQAMINAGQYPKFEGESFETTDHELALIPTAEVPLVNLHADEIIPQTELPRRYAAFTPCFRREAGAAGKDTRGLIRQHQFNKVELVVFATPENSNDELERLTQNAEAVLQRLELPYRVVSLCTGDLGFAATKTYDLEVWLPGQNRYREISSCSNCGDFQARRGRIRYRPVDDGQKGKAKPQLLHTLNGSGLAVGRTLVAVLENGQQPDGGIRLPSALVPYFGRDTIAPGD